MPQRASVEDSVDDYTSNATMMNKTQDIGKFMKRNLMLNKTMTQMMGKRRGESDSTKQVGAAGGGSGVYRERTVESILTDNDEAVSVMLPINQITTTHKQYNAIRDYANSTNIGHLKKMAQTHVSKFNSDFCIVQLR